MPELTLGSTSEAPLELLKKQVPRTQDTPSELESTELRPGMDLFVKFPGFFS